MPYRENYEDVLLKKQVCREHSFWPRVSSALAIRLHNYIHGRVVNTMPILDEILLLEGSQLAKRTPTKPAERFGGATLERFWHKHWTVPQFIGLNLEQQWHGPYAQKKELLKKEFEKALALLDADASAESQRRAEAFLSHAYVKGGYERRRSRGAMTGEWIIYYVHNGQNYYLDLGFHQELGDSRDPDRSIKEVRLLARLRRICEWEFPFAFADIPTDPHCSGQNARGTSP
jgi:hypothetical protein